MNVARTHCSSRHCSVSTRCHFVFCINSSRKHPIRVTWDMLICQIWWVVLIIITACLGLVAKTDEITLLTFFGCTVVGIRMKWRPKLQKLILRFWMHTTFIIFLWTLIEILLNFEFIWLSSCLKNVFGWSFCTIQYKPIVILTIFNLKTNSCIVRSPPQIKKKS